MSRLPVLLGALLVLVSGLLGGCGGGAGGGPPDPDDVTPALRAQAMDAVAAVMDALPTGSSKAERLATAARAIRARSEFEATGSSPELNTAWGAFPGGVLYIVDVSGRPRSALPTTGSEATAEQITPARNGIPRGPAVLCHTLDLSQYTNVAAKISPWLTAAGYSVTAEPTGAGGVADLRKLKGAAFFYMGSHGVAIQPTPGGAYVWAALTATEPTLTLDVSYAEDLADQSLVVVDGAFAEGRVRRYGITAGFVTKHMGFAPDSMVYMDSCRSDGPEAVAFKQACFDAGASLYVGWSRVVSDGACAESTPFLLCRMLSAPALDGADVGPPRRPFDYADAYSELRLRGWQLDDRTPVSEGAELGITEGPGSGAFLRPSIECLRVDESPTGASTGQSELIVRGSFGADPGSGPFHSARQVLCGGQELSIVSWTPTAIRATFPFSGPGSAGAVSVTVGGVTSNAVPLTEWWVPLLYRVQAEPGSGSTRFTEFTVNAHLRYDIHGWRESPTDRLQFALAEEEDPPTHFAGDSHGSFRCGGDQAFYDPETGDFIYKLVLGGSGSLPYLASGLGNGCWGSARLHYEYVGAEDEGARVPVLSIRGTVFAEGYPLTSHLLWADGRISNEERRRVALNEYSNGTIVISQGAPFELVIGEGGVIDAGEAGYLSWPRTLPRFEPTTATPRGD